jgi:hypothetical protein
LSGAQLYVRLNTIDFGNERKTRRAWMVTWAGRRPAEESVGGSAAPASAVDGLRRGEPSGVQIEQDRKRKLCASTRRGDAIFVIIASLQASDGKLYRYPVTIRFLT